MPKEIERKFLLKNDSWRNDVLSENKIIQGYLNSDKNRTVRVRVTNEKGYLTIKSKSTGSVRSEFEYEIPVNEATELIKLCDTPILSKTRHLVHHADHIWEVDVFEQENKGLEVAEIELNSEDESFEIPDWIGEEVTQDSRYFNSQLVSLPYSLWA